MKYLFFAFLLLNNTIALSQDLDTSPEVKQLAAGTAHGMALLINGTVWSWGRNGTGQLGDGSQLDKYIPVMIGTDSNWTCITAGKAFSHGIKKDGTLWGWGDNKVGQLGISTANIIYGYTKPVQVGTDTDWQTVSSGISFTVSLKKDGSIWVWGDKLYQLLHLDFNKYKPIKIAGDSNNNWVAVAAGDEFFIALKEDGTLWTRGVLNEQLQHSGGKDVFFKVSEDTTWVSFDAGKQHAVAIKKDGSLWAWGKNIAGQLGNGSTTTVKDPLRIGSSNDWQSVSAGGDYTIALKKDGTVWYWGDTGFMKDKANHTNVPTPFSVSVKYKCIAAARGVLLLTFAKAKMQGIVENYALGQDGTLKSFIINKN